MTGKLHRWLRTMVVFAAAAVSALAVLLVVAYWRLSSGAVSLDWFETRIEAALNNELAPLVVDLEQGSLRWSGIERPVSIRFGEARVVGSDLTELADIAGLSVDLSARALVSREIVLTGLEIDRIRLQVNREQDGSLSFVSGDHRQRTGTNSLALVDSLLRPPQPGTVLGQLAYVGIHSLDFEVQDRKLGVGWAAKDAALEVDRNRTDIRVKLAFVPVLEDPLGQATAGATFSFENETLETRLEFDVLEVAALSRLAATPELAEVMKGPLRGWVEVDFSADFMPEWAHFEIAGDPGEAAGRVDFAAGSRSPTATLELTGVEPWRFAGVRKKLAALDYIRIAFGGTVRVVLEDGSFERVEVDLQGDPGRLDLPGVYDQPLTLGASTLQGSIENGLQAIRVDELQTTLGDSKVVVSLRADQEEHVYDGSLRASVNRLAVDRLPRYWPPEVASGALSWVAENIPEGALSNIEFELAAQLTGGGGQQQLRVRDLAGSFDMHRLSVRALPPLPPVTGVDGRGALDANGLDFEVEGGRLGRVEIGDAAVSIGDFDSGRVAVSVRADLRTAVSAALELISAEPLSLIDESIIAAEDVWGDAEARLRVDVPLRGEAADERVEVEVEAAIEGFGWQQAPLGLELSEGDLELSLTESALQIQGQVSARGVATSIDYRADLVDPRRQTIEARARLTKADRDRLGIPDQSAITGPVTATVRFIAQPETAASIEAEIDLEESEIDLPFTSWRKPPGDSGRATLEAILEDAERWSIPSLSISAGDLVVQARATGDLRPARLRSLNVERFDFAKNKLQGSVTSDEEDVWQVRIAGDHLDIGNLPHEIAKARKRGSPGRAKGWKQPSVELDFHVDEVATNEEVILKGLSGSATFEGQSIGSLDLGAETRRGHELRLEAESRQGVRHGHLAAGDAGDLMKTLQVTTLFEGGELEMTAEKASADAPTAMRLNITDLGLTESGILGNILRIASLDGLLSTLEGEGFHFKKVDVDLEHDGGLLTIGRGRAYGQGITITVSGTADLANESLRVEGIVARMGAVQRAISKIPVLSKLLLGRRKSGFLGTEFKVSGPMAEPEVEVNPISTFTPGIMRDLLEPGEPNEHP